MLILGDSHSRMLGVSFDQFAHENNFLGILLYEHAYTPLPNTYSRPETMLHEKKLKDIALKKFILDNNIQTVLFSMRLGAYIHGSTIFENPHAKKSNFLMKYMYKNGDIEKDPVKALRLGFLAAMNFFNKYKIKVFILQPIPEMLGNIPIQGARILSSSKAQNIHKLLSVPRAFYDLRQKEVLQILKEMEGLGATILDPTEFLCDNELCYGYKDNNGLYYDDDHLNKYGVEVIKEVFTPVFQEITQKQLHTLK